MLLNDDSGKATMGSAFTKNGEQWNTQKSYGIETPRKKHSGET